MQSVYLIKDLYPKFIKNSQNSTISKQTTQLKIDKIFEKTFSQRYENDHMKRWSFGTLKPQYDTTTYVWKWL